jgi:hypothetical protein
MKVNINGEEHEVEQETLSYEQLVELAGYKGTPTATYYHNHHGGSLYKSKAVKLEDGMSFSVCHTNSA